MAGGCEQQEFLASEEDSALPKAARPDRKPVAVYAKAAVGQHAGKLNLAVELSDMFAPELLRPPKPTTTYVRRPQPAWMEEDPLLVPGAAASSQPDDAPAPRTAEDLAPRQVPTHDVLAWREAIATELVYARPANTRIFGTILHWLDAAEPPEAFKKKYLACDAIDVALAGPLPAGWAIAQGAGSAAAGSASVAATRVSI